MISIMNKSQLDLILQEVKQALQNLYQDQLSAIILYGSQAREEAKEFSDIDI
ncbi:MAG: nucleotidyltransferase domain-containing protein, partial [Sphaerospermopsis kisseleviana]